MAQKTLAALASLAVLTTSNLASADQPVSDAVQPQYTEDAHPAILYIPLESIVFSQNCTVAGNTGGNSALDCGFLGDVTVDLWSTDATEQTNMVDAITAALAPFAIRVTTERPPAYVPYHMLVLGNVELSGTSQACSASTTGSSCDGVKRNGIGVVASKVTDPMDMVTVTCENPDMLTAALYTVGRLAGLEGTDVAGDPMLYPADYANNPATMFQDSCGAVTFDMPACNTLSHQTHCNDMNGQMNSHQELLAVYGAAPAEADTTAPELANIVPADGDVIPDGGMLVADVDITDDSNIVAVRWTIKNDEVFAEGTNVPGELSHCTNTVCDSGWQERWIDMRADSQDWALKVGLPAGDYVVDLEVSDLAGNTVTNTATVTIEPKPGGSTSGGGSTTGDPTTTSGGSTSTTGDTDTDGSGSDSDGNGGGGGGGCSVQGGTTAPLGALFLLGLGALRLRRRD